MVLSISHTPQSIQQYAIDRGPSGGCRLWSTASLRRGRVLLSHSGWVCLLVCVCAKEVHMCYQNMHGMDKRSVGIDSGHIGGSNETFNFDLCRVVLAKRTVKKPFLDSLTVCIYRRGVFNMCMDIQKKINTIVNMS